MEPPPVELAVALLDLDSHALALGRPGRSGERFGFDADSGEVYSILVAAFVIGSVGRWGRRVEAEERGGWGGG